MKATMYESPAMGGQWLATVNLALHGGSAPSCASSGSTEHQGWLLQAQAVLKRSNDVDVRPCGNRGSIWGQERDWSIAPCIIAEKMGHVK